MYVLWCDVAVSVEYSSWGCVLRKRGQNRRWEELMESNTKSKKAQLMEEGWIILFYFSKDETEMNFNTLLCTFLGPLAGANYITGWSEFI